ncbi:MAG TPA: ABC transporter permease [Bryobacteraceae bacterium]|jgi:predicted permease
MMLRKLFNFLRPNRLDADLREELEFHRAHSSGSLGNLALVQDRMRDASTIAWLETAAQDIRYGLRQLARAPVLVSVAILSLALGIGANTAIFTLINAFMLQALPVRDPGRLALFNDSISGGVYSGGDFKANEFSYPSWQYIQAHNDVFEDIAAFRQGTDILILHVSGFADSGPREQTKAHLVSGNYFSVLGVAAAAGRVLQPSDDSPTAPRTAVISYPFWRDRFHLDPGIIGQTVVLSGTAFNIIGVAAREFFGERMETAPDFWLPLSVQQQILGGDSWLTARTVYWLNFMARLKPGVTLATAQAAANVRLHEFYLEQAGAHPSADLRRQIENTQIQLKPGGGGISGLRYLYSKPLHVLMGVVAIVLLIACANIATLILARASARRPEFLARMALGASRARLLRQVLTENVLLSFIGGAVGVGFAWWSVKLLILFLHVNPVVKVRPDPIVLAFTLALSIVTGILFGIIPALKFSRMEPRSGSLARSSFWGSGQVLIALQVSLSLILLLGAGLLAHSLLALEEQDLGFQRDNILSVRIDANLADYQQSQLYSLYREIGERMARLPGVLSASVVRFTPESGSSSSSNFSMEGFAPNPTKKMDVYTVPAGPGFFETLRIPILRGRAIGPRDMPTSPQVVVVNQTFVNLYLPHENPIGKHMMTGSPFKAPGAEIVGVAADSKFYDLREKARPMAFFALWQQPVPGVEIVLRTAIAPASITAEVRQALQQVSSKLPILKVTTLNNQIEHSLDQQKMITTLCGIFGVLALVLASVGIYGTLAYAVARRTSEIGIRMAIGAQRRNVIWMVLRDSLVLISAGIILGLPLALGGTRWLSSFLFGVQRVDPLAIGSAVLLILIMALLAGYLPAWRAAKTDPMRALRHE